jgi:hypothetical protein
MSFCVFRCKGQNCQSCASILKLHKKIEKRFSHNNVQFVFDPIDSGISNEYDVLPHPSPNPDPSMAFMTFAKMFRMPDPGANEMSDHVTIHEISDSAMSVQDDEISDPEMSDPEMFDGYWNMQV